VKSEVQILSPRPLSGPPADRVLPIGERPGPDELLSETELNAADITVEGLVQGVGFREFTRRHARDLGLSGYVLNSRDGCVQVRAEGEREAIEALVRALEQGPRLARVERVALRWSEATGAWPTFSVRSEDGAW
jgi:acylphosphatase